MLPPLPRRGNGRHCIAHPSRRASLPRIGCRVGPRIVLFEVCSAFTHVAACTLALPPNRGSLTRRLQPLRFLRSCSGASGWSSSPGGPLTHWKAPPYHGARHLQTFDLASQFACGFNWSAQHMLGLRDARGSACHIGTNRKGRCSWALSLVLVRSRIVAKPRHRKAIGLKPLSVKMDGVASTG